MATKLILIRHGQTTANREKKYSGFMDVRLDAEGIRQARKLYKRLKAVKVDKVYASDRKRAIESANIIFRDFPIEVMKDLREMHFGLFEGLTYEQLMKKYPRIFKKWLDNPFATKIPRGEHLAYFRKRVICAINKIVSSHPKKTVAVVCHGGTISILLNSISTTRDFWRKIPKSASLSVIEYKNGKPKICLFNDTAHINEEKCSKKRRCSAG